MEKAIKPPKMGFEQTAEQQSRLGDLLWDVHAAGGKIVEFTAARGFEDFAESDVLRSVVRSMLGIMVTGLDAVRSEFPTEFGRLDDAPALLKASLDEDAKVWRMVEETVPAVAGQVRELLEDWHQS